MTNGLERQLHTHFELDVICSLSSKIAGKSLWPRNVPYLMRMGPLVLPRNREIVAFVSNRTLGRILAMTGYGYLFFVLLVTSTEAVCRILRTSHIICLRMFNTRYHGVCVALSPTHTINAYKIVHGLLFM